MQCGALDWILERREDINEKNMVKSKESLDFTIVLKMGLQ